MIRLSPLDSPDMFLQIFAVLFVSVTGRDIVEPQFQVLTPNELMIQVPSWEDATLVTFRIGVRRKDNELEDLELGENVMNNNRIFIYDERLGLKRDDVVNYLLAYRDKEGYQAQTGRYIFDGVYYKKPFGRRHRFRRSALTTTEKSEYNVEDSEEIDSVESRFGGGHHHHRGFWPHRGHPYLPPRQGPPPFGPQFPIYPQHGPPPNFGFNCDDHRHDMCHKHDTERWEKATSGEVFGKDYHCRICHKDDSVKVKSKIFTTTTTTTTTPKIDIRFSDD